MPTANDPAASLPPAPRWSAMRALTSAMVFGYIGQRIGRWLGSTIKSKVAESTMRWSMGSFWAVLAAYSSLKATAMERGETIAESAPTDAVAMAKLAEPSFVPNAKTPLSLIETESARNHGKLQTPPQLQVAAK